MAMFTKTREKSETGNFAEKNHSQDFRPQEKYFQEKKTGGNNSLKLILAAVATRVDCYGGSGNFVKDNKDATLFALMRTGEW